MIRHAFVALGVALILFSIVVHCSGCGLLASRAGAAVSVVEYRAALDECRADGKRAKSYAVYEACAREADARYGLDGGAQ